MAGVISMCWSVCVLCMRTNLYDVWLVLVRLTISVENKIHFVQRHLWLPFKLWQKERRKKKIQR